jgi:cytochrome P450
MFSKAFQVRCFGFSWWDRFLRERARFDALIYEDIRERRAKGTRGDDILSIFMDARYENGEQLDDNALRDELMTLLLAGHETTQIAISWVMSWLHRSDDARERLLTDGSLDMGEPDGWARSPWLGAVVNESLRLNPILPDVVRTLKVPFELSGVPIPAGYHVAVATSLLHTNPEVYDRPHEFVPQRFIDHTFRPHEYTPFGGGLRRCIAASLATYEIHIVVATWMREHRFALTRDAPEKEPVHRRNVTMAPTSGIPLTYRGSR